MRQLFNIPKDLWGPAPWHKARIELQGFVKQNRAAMCEHEVEFARWLYGPFELANHHTPPWSTGSPAYVESVYNFINNQLAEMEEHEAKIKELYISGMADPGEIQKALVVAGFRKLTLAYIRSVINLIKKQKAA